MADVTDIREAVRAKLSGDATLTGMLGSGDRIFYQQVRDDQVVPVVLFSDTGTRPDPLVPLHERALRVTCKHTTFEAAEGILERIRVLLHGKPLTIPGTGWRFMGCYVGADDEAPVADGDVIERSLTFRLLAYEVA